MQRSECVTQSVVVVISPMWVLRLKPEPRLGLNGSEGPHSSNSPLKTKDQMSVKALLKGGEIAFPQPPKHPFVLWVWIVQKVDSSVQRSAADVSILSDWLVAISPIYPFTPHTKTWPVNLTLHPFLANVFTLKPTHTQLSCLPPTQHTPTLSLPGALPFSPTPKLFYTLAPV